jgi:hypothetical protein
MKESKEYQEDRIRKLMASTLTITNAILSLALFHYTAHLLYSLWQWVF